MSDTPPDADQLAMQRLASGDDTALGEIMNRWKEKVASFVHRMTGDADTAADLAMETFVRVYQHRLSYQPNAAFATYLFRIAANLSRNHLRWQRRHPSVSLEDLSMPLEAGQEQPSPEEDAAFRERLTIIENAISALPPDLKEAILLFTYEDMSYAEIASTSRCSIKAVETRIYRARQILKSLLKDGSF